MFLFLFLPWRGVHLLLEGLAVSILCHSGQRKAQRSLLGRRLARGFTLLGELQPSKIVSTTPSVCFSQKKYTNHDGLVCILYLPVILITFLSMSVIECYMSVSVILYKIVTIIMCIIYVM